MLQLQIIITTNKPDLELADDSLALEPGRPEADPGFVADPVLLVGEEGFSTSHLWLLPLGTAVVGDGLEGAFAGGFAAPPYTINLTQKCLPRKYTNKNSYQNCVAPYLIMWFNLHVTFL